MVSRSIPAAFLVTFMVACGAPVRPAQTAAAPEAPHFALSLVGRDGHKQAYVILEQEIGGTWSTGEPVLLDADASRIAAARPIDRSRLPESMRAALRDRYSVADWSNTTCEGGLGEPIELRLIDPQLLHASDQLELAAAWQEEPYARVLAAPVQADCDIEARWAVRAAQRD